MSPFGGQSMANAFTNIAKSNVNEDELMKKFKKNKPVIETSIADPAFAFDQSLSTGAQMGRKMGGMAASKIGGPLGSMAFSLAMAGLDEARKPVKHDPTLIKQNRLDPKAMQMADKPWQLPGMNSIWGRPLGMA